MFDSIISLFTTVATQVGAYMTIVSAWVNEVSGGNDFLAAAIMGGLVTGAGYGLWIFKKGLPGFLKRRFMVSITIDNDSQNTYDYHIVSDMVSKWATSFGSRSFFVSHERYERDGEEFRGAVMKPGLGSHWFVRNKRLFWFSIHDLESSGSERQKKRMSIYTYGLNPQPLRDLLHCAATVVKRGMIDVNCYDAQGNSQYMATANFPPLKNLAINDDVKEYYYDLINNFKANVSEANKRGESHKYVSTIHGEPGSGKTSIICSIARDLGVLDVYMLSLEDLKDTGALRRAINVGSRHYPTVIVIEDIHGFSPVLKEEFSPEGTKLIDGGITLQGVLNTLNGVVPMHNIMVFITTNYIERIDEALLRPGRCDAVVELPRISAEIANKWLGERIENYKPLIKEPLRGCDLYQITAGTGFDKAKIERNADAVLPKIPAKPTYVYNDSNKVIFKDV